MRGFILAAGEGTRLRPLTEKIPKPLIPVFHKPLLTFALDHFLSLGVREIGINTRYLWKKFYTEFAVTSEEPSSNGENTFYAKGNYHEHPLHFFRESVPIGTGGALRNARSFLEQGPFLLHNGDIFSNIPLTDLIEHHRKSGSITTLLLRDEGGLKNVGYDEKKNQVTSIRDISPNAQENPLFFYPGIAVVEPALLDWINPTGPASLIDALLAAMQAGHTVAAFVSNIGFASDLGTPEAYLKIHRTVQEQDWKFPFSLHHDPSFPWPTAIHPTATIAPSAKLHGSVVIGPGACVGENAKLTNCILLPKASVAADQELSERILF
ncbi:MAG: NDP-sugar synthase [Chthoniobacterales bacterium]|nr:NDP-sugar synthase [Chthoniobacterales bacterium]